MYVTQWLYMYVLGSGVVLAKRLNMIQEFYDAYEQNVPHLFLYILIVFSVFSTEVRRMFVGIVESEKLDADTGGCALHALHSHRPPPLLHPRQLNVSCQINNVQSKLIQNK